MDAAGDSFQAEKGENSLLRRRAVRSVYLVTYSQANADVVLCRDPFAVLVRDSFLNAQPKCQSRVMQ